jgi:hypothetical protein
MDFRLLITANAVLAEAADAPLDELLAWLFVDPLVLVVLVTAVDTFFEPVAVTVSPAAPESVMIVPSWGARSLVCTRASSALRTAASSLRTADFANTRFASRVVALTDELEVVEDAASADFVDVEDDVPAELSLLLCVLAGVVVVLVVVEVDVGAVVVVVGVVVVGVVPVSATASVTETGAASLPVDLYEAVVAVPA